MALEDYEGYQRLVDLITGATSQDAADPAWLRLIKQACKSSESNVRNAFDLLFAKLEKPNSEERLAALEVCAELFTRSKLFRSLVSASFTRFLELTVGFRIKTPLPGPPAAAERLRCRALELVERWSADYGTRNKQIYLGYSYMRNTLRFDFPEVDARRAAAEAAQRRRDERAQSLAQERYHRLLQEWERQADEARGVLAQFKEALALLEVPEQDAAADGGVEWEDVGTEEAQGAIRTSGADGLAAYAAEVEPSIPSELARTGTHASVNSGDMDVVIETVDGLYKLVCTNLLPRTQEALRTIVSAEAGVPGQPAYAQRERLLRAATELKTELTSAKEGYEASQLHLRALAAAQARRQGDVPGGDLEPAGPSGSRPEQPAELGEHNPYHFIKDPAAPQKNTLQRRMLKAPSTAKPRARPPGDAATSSLPASVRATLAARAPVLPAGAFVRVWDSSAPPMYVSNHGMEVANHWGPVDVHQELPQERIDELFLYAASDRVPQATGHAANNSQATSTSRVANRNRHNEAGTSGVTLQGRELGLLGGVMFETGRAQRAAERAYNDAIIAGATADERLAQDMQQAEMGGDGSGRANGKKRGPKRIPVKERLRKRLLTGRAMAVAQNDLAAMERDRLQEKSNNRWENK